MSMDEKTSKFDAAVAALVAAGWSDRRENTEPFSGKGADLFCEIVDKVASLPGDKRHLWSFSPEKVHLTRVVGRTECGLGLSPSGRMTLFCSQTISSPGKYLRTSGDAELAVRFLSSMDVKIITGNEDYSDETSQVDTGLDDTDQN